MSEKAETRRRSDDQWIASLGGSGPAAADAQAELRVLIRRTIQKATRGFGVLDEATLEDLTQVALLNVLQKLDRFEGRSRFTTWAYSVAVHAAFSELRRASYRHRPPGEDEASRMPEEPDRAGDASAPAERDEIVRALERVIAEDLTERQRAAIQGELNGASAADLAEELGSSPNAIYKLLHDARAKLRDGLQAAGIEEDEVREAFGL